MQEVREIAPTPILYIAIVRCLGSIDPFTAKGVVRNAHFATTPFVWWGKRGSDRFAIRRSNNYFSCGSM